MNARLLPDVRRRAGPCADAHHPCAAGARVVSGVVPGPRKAQAVRDALRGPVSTACPASILRTHANAVLHVDDASAGLLG
ncbi:MAG: hypothetical protein HC841_09550 [Verrucomicrobiae bacterium]|nr:hypothetical protein [Verrucomicrobiae bacterium]